MTHLLVEQVVPTADIQMCLDASGVDVPCVVFNRRLEPVAGILKGRGICLAGGKHRDGSPLDRLCAYKRHIAEWTGSFLGGHQDVGKETSHFMCEALAKHFITKIEGPSGALGHVFVGPLVESSMNIDGCDVVPDPRTPLQQEDIQRRVELFCSVVAREYRRRYSQAVRRPLRPRGRKPLVVGDVFFSYSHHDVSFARKLKARLECEGVRCWLDINDLKAGHITRQVYDAMANNDIVLFISSASSLRSDWVQFELSLARQKEIREQRHVLCPVALDDAWRSPDDTCIDAVLLREVFTRYAVDFCAWRNEDEFELAFERVWCGLNIYFP